MAEIRSARLEDVPAIAELVQYFAQRDELLPRSEDEIRASLERWLVTEVDGSLVAVGSLVPYSDVLVEVRSLAVAPDQQGQGYGRELVEALAKTAEAQAFHELFALTRAVDFFARCGFAVVGMERFPQKVWTDCARCPLREHCDETAMVRYLNAEAGGPKPIEWIEMGELNGKG